MAAFSVCTAFFNDSVSDAEALWDSICAQRVDFEWVVADDFSEDPSVRSWLLELSARDPRVRYVEQERKMQFMRNPAPFALGDYVFHIDSDDLVLPGYLEACERVFAMLPEVGVVLANSVFVDQHGSFAKYQQHGLNGMCFLGRCWRRVLGPDLSPVLGDGFFTFCNDMFIVRALAVSCRVVVLPRIFVRYREHRVEGTGRYEPFGARMRLGEEHHRLHAQALSAFMEWYGPRQKRAEGCYPLYEPVFHLARALWPLHGLLFDSLSWLGFSDVPEWQRMLLEGLYPERAFLWGEESEGSLRICAPGVCLSGEWPALAFFPPGSEAELEQARLEIGPHMFFFQDGCTWLIRG